MHNLFSYNGLQMMDGEFAPDLSRHERYELEMAGMTPRAVDDAISMLRLSGAKSITVADVLAIGPLRTDETPAPLWEDDSDE
jgi:hypothetical protein